uniref:Uncharacterized protein n=1 Tax=Acrobeloides nanus TaxID=290746 RepID=A0A914DK30_9BILA
MFLYPYVKFQGHHYDENREPAPFPKIDMPSSEIQQSSIVSQDQGPFNSPLTAYVSYLDNGRSRTSISRSDYSFCLLVTKAIVASVEHLVESELPEHRVVVVLLKLILDSIDLKVYYDILIRNRIYHHLSLLFH